MKAIKDENRQLNRMYLDLSMQADLLPDALAVPEAPNITWSMDFMTDLLGDGRQFRLLNVRSTAKGWGSGSTFIYQQ